MTTAASWTMKAIADKDLTNEVLAESNQKTPDKGSSMLAQNNIRGPGIIIGTSASPPATSKSTAQPHGTMGSSRLHLANQRRVSQLISMLLLQLVGSDYQFLVQSMCRRQ